MEILGMDALGSQDTDLLKTLFEAKVEAQLIHGLL
jgi:hypothetical protein